MIPLGGISTLQVDTVRSRDDTFKIYPFRVCLFPLTLQRSPSRRPECRAAGIKLYYLVLSSISVVLPCILFCMHCRIRGSCSVASLFFFIATWTCLQMHLLHLRSRWSIGFRVVWVWLIRRLHHIWSCGNMLKEFECWRKLWCLHYHAM